MISRTICRSDVFERVKKAVNIRDALEKYGVIVNRNGQCLCPLHSEDTPSCKIYENSFYCFGCGQGGDVITLVAKMFGLSNVNAAKKLAHDFGIESDAAHMSAGAIRRARLEQARRERERVQKGEHKERLDALTIEYRALLNMKPPNSPDDFGRWAASRARLAELDAFFEAEEVNACRKSTN